MKKRNYGCSQILRPLTGKGTSVYSMIHVTYSKAKSVLYFCYDLMMHLYMFTLDVYILSVYLKNRINHNAFIISYNHFRSYISIHEKGEKEMLLGDVITSLA